MATYTAARAKHQTLTGSTVDTVTLGPAVDAVTYGGVSVEVLNRGATDPIYFTIDGSTPTAAGDDTYVVPPNYGAVKIPGASSGVVKLISAGAMAYSVTLS